MSGSASISRLCLQGRQCPHWEIDMSANPSKRPARVVRGLVGLAVLLATLLWLAEMHRPSDALASLPAPSAVAAASADESPVASAPLTFHGDAKLDHLMPEPDPSPAAVAAYGKF
jgi:hypothetical protein